MKNSFLVIALILLGTVTSQSLVGGDFKKCAEDVQNAVKLGEQIKTDYQNGDIAGLINDAALTVQLGINVSQDCNFTTEVKEEFGECFKNLEEMLNIAKDIKKNFLMKNPTDSIQQLIEAAAKFSSVQEQCPKSKEEVIERISKKRGLTSIPNLSAYVDNIGFQALHPIACAHDAYKFGLHTRNFLRAAKNETIDQVVLGLVELLVQVPPLLDECGIQVPSWLNDTVAIEECATSLIKGYELLETAVQDFEDNKTTALIEDAIAIGYQIVRIKNDCETLVAEELEKKEALLLQVEESKVTWTPTFPFNITDCLQGTTDFSALFGNLWNAINSGQSTGNIITDVSQIVVAVEPLLRTCGESKVADFLAKEVPESCLVSIADISQVVDDIYEHRENTLYILTALGQLYTTFVKLRDNCPFLQSIVPELQPYDFENHQRIEKLQAQNDLENTIFDNIYSVNITECLLQSETLSEVAQEMESLIINKEENFDLIVDQLVLVSKQLVNFMPACGFGSFISNLNELMPQSCIGSIADASKLMSELLDNKENTKYIVDSLPQVYDHLVALRNTCPTIDAFVDPFFPATEEVQVLTQATQEAEKSKLFSFNVTQCVKSSEKLSAEIGFFKVLFAEEEKNVPELLESIARIKDNAQFFLSKCGLEEYEAKLEEAIPTMCVESTKEFLKIAHEAIYGDYILAEIIDVLPAVYTYMIKINDNCPKVATSFIRK